MYKENYRLGKWLNPALILMYSSASFVLPRFYIPDHCRYLNQYSSDPVISLVLKITRLIGYPYKRLFDSVGKILISG